MSHAGKIALIVAAVAVAVVAFVVASPGGDDDEGDRAAATVTTSATDPAETATETAPEPPPRPKPTRIRMRAGEVVGGAKTVEVESGDRVQIVVTTDTPDELHLHGYDLTRQVAPGRPGRFSFTADAEGEFELESHEAEHRGLEALVARVVVNPS